jgi:superfamily II DNA/RNA helicase
MDKFKHLGMSPELLQALEEMKFSEPTEIQEKTIPLVLAGKDVIAGASTGSGKTLAFGTSIIENCSRQGVIQALVMVPTRELADQVAKSLKVFSKYKPLAITEVYGGVSMGPQVSKLRRSDVVVGTPGRILDHIEHQTVDFGYVKILVLDEADRMLDMGFVRDVKKIIEQVPQKRQTLLFSATISRDIRAISDDYMNKPVEIFTESQVDPTKLAQSYYDVPDNMKFSLLAHLIKNDHSKLVMIFCNTQRNTDFVARNLQNMGVNALAIHGGYSQDKRTRTMEKFQEGSVHVLVCTDVAARGLDVKGVSHVYNYDVPNEANQYVHRIGRTARAGAEGKAVTILASRDYENFTFVKRISKCNIVREDLPEMQKVEISYRGESRDSGGYGGRWGGSGGSRGSSGSRWGGSSRGGSSGGRSFGSRSERPSSGGFSRGRSEGSEGGFGERRSFGGNRGGGSRGGGFSRGPRRSEGNSGRRFR